jgi:RAB protein geranylgeranyltransferase component A
MSKLELQKEQLHHKIDAINDERLLQKIIDMVNEEDIVWQRVEKGRQELADGKIISHEEAKKRTEEWLKEKK